MQNAHSNKYIQIYTLSCKIIGERGEKMRRETNWLRIGEAAKQLGVDIMTLRKWDEQGKLQAERTANGHRKYKKETIDTLLAQRQTASSHSIADQIQRTFTLFARSLIELHENTTIQCKPQYPSLWIKQSNQLHTLSLECGAPPFPLSIDEQYQYWKMPLTEWGFPHLESILAYNWFEDKAVLYNNGEPTPFCFEIASAHEDPEGNEDIRPFVQAMRQCRAQGDEENYRRLRLFPLDNPILTMDDTWFDKILSIPNEYLEIIQRLYEPIPETYIIEDRIYICPHCKWTLKRHTNGHFVCYSDRCLITMNRLRKPYDSHVTFIPARKTQQRIRSGALYYIVWPGIAERRIYKEITALLPFANVTLYPQCDATDLLIEFPNGPRWALDIKDWSNDWKLAKKLSEEPTSPFEGADRNYIVIPKHYPAAYTERLRANAKLPEYLSIVTEKEMMRMLNFQKNEWGVKV